MHLLVNVPRPAVCLKRQVCLKSWVRSLNRISLSLLFLAAPLVLAACTEPPPPPPPPVVEAPPPPFQHVVRYSGETLGLIAKWYTGKSQNWQALRQANPNINPNRINIGDVVSIPNELVTRKDALPKNAVSKWVSASATMDKKEPDATAEPASEEATLSKGAVPETPPPPSGETAAPAAASGKSGAEDLDALEKELESALAERGKDKPAAPASEPPKSGGKGDEAEREKLLDELLAQ